MTKEEQQALLKCGLFAGMTGQEAEQLLHCVGGGVLHYEKIRCCGIRGSRWMPVRWCFPGSCGQRR